MVDESSLISKNYYWVMLLDKKVVNDKLVLMENEENWTIGCYDPEEYGPYTPWAIVASDELSATNELKIGRLIGRSQSDNKPV